MFFSEETRTRTGVVVSATHPTLGPLYWHFSDESSVGGPDYYGITDRIDLAFLLDEGWRETRSFKIHGDHISRVLRELEEDCGLHSKAGQTFDEFREWLRSAPWADEPGPARDERLVDHGYFYTWETMDK